MARQHSKTSALLFATVYTGFLCLCQVACQLDGNIDEDTQEPSIARDKFAVRLEDATKNRNFVVVSIQPGSSGMALQEFFVTASLENDVGVARGSSNKNSSGFVYDGELNNCNLEGLFLTKKSLNCLGKDDTSFKQGKKVSFRIKSRPGATIKKGDQYILTVTVERRGSHPHVETESIALTAKQDGVDTKEQTGEESTAEASSSTPDAALGTVSGSTIPHISHPTPSTDLPIPAREATTIEARPQMLVSDAGLPATPNSETPNTSPEQITDPSDSATADSSNDTDTSTQQDGEDTKEQTEAASTSGASLQTPELGPAVPLNSAASDTNLHSIGPSDSTEDVASHNADTSSQTPTSDKVTVTLQDETRSNGVRNFVLVTIQPSENGIALSDCFVTASIADNNGSVKGSSAKKQSGFVYNNALNRCSLGKLFFQNVDCLGVNDTSFAQGKAVSFRIESKPGATTRPDDQYTLTVKVERKGSNAHTETQSITLTATQASPSKGRKRTSPRK